MHTFTTVLVALVLAAGAFGCGGDDDGTTPDGSTGIDGGSVADSGPPPEDGGPMPEDGGPVPEDGGPVPDGGECSCIGDSLQFGYIGGFVATSRASTLSTCRTFGLVETDLGSGGGEMSCSNEVPCLGDVITIDDVLAALGHADVVAAFAAAPVLYGVDSRPVDGQVFRITRGGQEVLVGDPCGSASGCTAIPAGVGTLAALLRSLTTARLAEPDCSTVFPGG